MQKCAHLVELGKCCQTYIYLAKFRFDTAENEPAKKLQNLQTFPDFANPDKVHVRARVPLRGRLLRGQARAGPPAPGLLAAGAGPGRGYGHE